MNIQIQAINLDLTEAIKQYVEKKISSLQKYLDPKDESVKCLVELSLATRHHQTGDIFRVEADMHTAGHNYHVSAQEEDLYAAIDVIRDDLAAAIRKTREKDIDLQRKGATEIKNKLRGIE